MGLAALPTMRTIEVIQEASELVIEKSFCMVGIPGRTIVSTYWMSKAMPVRDRRTW